MSEASILVCAAWRPIAALGVALAVGGFADGAARAAATGGTPEDCDNGIDDNGNGLVDCAEVKACRDDPACVEVGERCADGLDNDFNGLTDCADRSCVTEAPCRESGDNCVDGLDNDGDAAIDCADSECTSFLLCSDQVCLDVGTVEIEFFLVVELAGGELKSARCRTSMGGNTNCDTAGTGANGRPLLALGPPMCGGAE